MVKGTGSFSVVLEGPRDNPHRWVDLATTKAYGVHITPIFRSYRNDVLSFSEKKKKKEQFTKKKPYMANIYFFSLINIILIK